MTFEQPAFAEIAKRAGFELYDKPRGAPENVGAVLKAVHPVVRTNPVTGWKSIFPVGGHVKLLPDGRYEMTKQGRKWLDPASDSYIGDFIADTANYWEW